MNFLSAKNGHYIINELSTQVFDVLIIGGGITGAGVALDAASRGLKVALIEMQDFAAGTSSRSTKLIHGGLRYLKQLEFKLVAEVGKEREIVHNNAPHLTKPEPMLLPIVKNGSLGKYSSILGMTMYEWLAGVKNEEKFKFLTTEETIKKEPLLKKEGLLGGILFYEYRTDDARLTIEVLKEAVAKGAIIRNYIKANSFIYSNGEVSGAKITDMLTQQAYTIKAHHIVNAGGPWVDEISDRDNPKNEHKLQITKGVHLVVDWKKLPISQAAYFDTFDKRMLFVIPREGKTYIGTTDTFYKEDLINPEITEEDKTYVLKCVNDYFPHNLLTANDIESGWAGLRPLVNKPGKGPSEISRKDELFISSSGLITIAGGKLTGYRKMAERVVNTILMQNRNSKSIKTKKCITQHIKLPGAQFKSNFSDFLTEKIKEAYTIGLTKDEAELLCYRYGVNTNKIFEYIKTHQTTYDKPLPIYIYAQLVYCIENELCFTADDFLIRRTGTRYFDIDLYNKYKYTITELLLESIH